MKLIEEHDHVEYSKRSELAYRDDGASRVELYVNDKPIGEIEVYTDVSGRGTEYICVNHEIVYLDDIRERFDCE